VFADRLVVEEAEDLVFPDRSASAETDLIKATGVAENGARGFRTVPRLIRVEAGTVRGEERAAMKVVRAAFGGDLNLGA